MANNMETLNKKLYYCAECKQYFSRDQVTEQHACNCSECIIHKSYVHHSFYNDKDHHVKEVDFDAMVAFAVTFARKNSGEGSLMMI